MGASHTSARGCHDKSALEAWLDVACQGKVPHGVSSFLFFRKPSGDVMEGEEEEEEGNEDGGQGQGK